MRSKTLSLTVSVLLWCTITTGQTDSTKIYAGNLSFSSSFTQHLTVTGADLERFPFSSLDEAIKVYFYGAYTNPRNIVYIVDGNIGVDVNAYSIHDIERITLINDARSIINGDLRGKHLVIVTTKARFTRRSGFTVAASEYLVSDSNNTFFHKVYTSGIYARKNFEMGASLNYLHEAFPLASNNQTIRSRPNELNRVGINAWMILQFGRSSVLTLRTNYSPVDSSSEREFFDYQLNTYKTASDGSVNHLYPTLNLQSKIGSGFYNTFDAGYLSHTDKWEKYTHGEVAGGYTSTSLINTSIKKTGYIVRDEFGYTSKKGRWIINPTININAQFNKAKQEESEVSFWNNGPVAVSKKGQKNKDTRLYIIPAFAVSNSNVFNLQIGAQYHAVNKQAFREFKPKVYPFGAVALDAIRIFTPKAPTGLMLHMSYAMSGSDVFQYQALARWYYSPGPNGFDSLLMVPLIVSKAKHHTNTNVGATLSLMQNRIKVNYNHERNNYFINIFESAGVPGNFFYTNTEANIRLSTHRVTAEYNTAEKGDLRYRGMLGLYYMKSNFVYEINPPLVEVTHQGYYPPRGLSGGFANQFVHKKFIGGINVLYYFSEHRWLVEPGQVVGYEPVLHKLNSLALQHIYAGYKLSGMEVYVSGRNVLASKENTFINSRRKYYGIGMKLML